MLLQQTWSFYKNQYDVEKDYFKKESSTLTLGMIQKTKTDSCLLIIKKNDELWLIHPYLILDL